MALLRRVSGTFFRFTLISLSCLAAPLQAQVPRPANFLAEHYDVSASLDAIGQSISATAKIDFKAVEASSSVRVELHPNLVVKEVKGADGKPLTFERDNQNPLIVVVQLPTPVATDGHGKVVPAHKLSLEPLHGDIPAERSRHLCRRWDWQVLRSGAPARQKRRGRRAASLHFRVQEPRRAWHLCSGQSPAQSQASGRN